MIYSFSLHFYWRRVCCLLCQCFHCCR